MKTLAFSQMSDDEVLESLAKNKIGLTVEEARKIEEILRRPPTITEAVLWGIQGSEHCSYKSSRQHLKMLPIDAPNVVLGVGEDSGIVEICKIKGNRYGLVVSHESHNHPSQIVPYEGAATGVGGCVRDVACMGGKVIGIMDPLRFGAIDNTAARQIANGVVSGIGGYGNPIGIPNLGGDLYFDPSFNDNCLVNVVAIGVIKESHIIHSFVSPQAAKEKWDIIVVGKPTDFSGMGGASFASVILKESEKEKNKGAVQEPNPFLKRHLLVSTYDLFSELQKKKLINKVSYKDMGAGGISCSTVEQVAKVGLGAEIDLGKVHVSVKGLPPSVIACAETQERFTWMCHPSLTKMILDHYNKKWDLPSVAENARASLVGKVTNGNYVLKFNGEKVVNASSHDVTEGLLYDRPYFDPKNIFEEPEFVSPKDFNKELLALLASENIASRKPIYEHYDKQVQGFVVMEAGVADAGILAPLMDEDVDPRTKKIGMAFSTDSNPRHSLISPYHGAANAVVESMRNVAAVGAYPQAITDCLNYGNPEKPEQMWELKEGITGIRDACNGIKLKNHPESATPVISGNVSLYNESKNGHIAPTAVICCIGKVDDHTKAVTMQFKKSGSKIYLLGARKNELGGSEFYRLRKQIGANVPQADFTEAQKEIYTLVDAIAAGLVSAAHDISEGGVAVAVAEMAFGGWADGKIGAEVNLDRVKLADRSEAEVLQSNKFAPANTKLPQAGLQAIAYSRTGFANTVKLFSETGGFVCEVPASKSGKFEALCKKNQLTPYEIGKTTTAPKLIFKSGGKLLVNLELKKASARWLNGLREKLN